jgi:uncharacterized protein YukE
MDERTLAMKIMYTVGALLSLAAFLLATAQTEANLHHASGQTTSVVQTSQHDAEINTLRQKLEGYEKQLSVKLEVVEDARQQAISAGIQGDGAQPYIDAYRQEQREMEALQAALTPQIEQARATITQLTSTDARASLLSQNTDSRKTTRNNDLMASGNSSYPRAARK